MAMSSRSVVTNASPAALASASAAFYTLGNYGLK
jgi:hypothetical protein